MTKNFFPKEFFSRLPLRIFLTFQLWVFLFPLLLVKSYSIPNPFQYISKRSWVTEMSVVLALVSLIVGTFLIIQWPYVFARVALESDLSRFGVATYSEYVRRGFQELIFIAVFLYVLVWAGHLALRIKKERDKTILPVVQVLVLGELLLLIVSVFRRIWLYQMHHGWSLMRVYGGFFLMWMLGMVVILSLRHIFKIRWIVVESLFTAMVIGLFVWIPSEQIFILAHPPTVNNRVDYVNLSRLSPDGYEGWIKAFTWAESVVAKNNHGQALSKEDRRDVAYAGDIIEQISKRYHILIRTYGNKEQKSRYVISVYEFQLKQLEKTMQSELLSKQQQVKDATALHAWLGERLQKPVAEANASELIRNITFSTHFGPASKGDIFYTGKPENLMSFYTIRQQPSWPLQDYTQLDRIFMWNKSQTQALQRIMTDIPIERLIAVHDAFISLYQQILTQPNNSYDADVSYDTPLLESL